MTDNPGVDRINRRGLLGLAAGLVGLGGLAVLAEKVHSSQQTVEQERAQELLDNLAIPKQNFKVKNHPDIIKENGLAVRHRPLRTDEIKDSEKPPALFRLQPGDPIDNAVYFEGSDPDFPERVSLTGWVAFKHNDPKTGAERIVFAANRPGYLAGVYSK